MSDAHSVGAALVITEAVERFRDSVSPDDQAQIESTDLKDVLSALLDMQKYLQNKRENRNLRKLYPFVEGLQRYSGAIDTLSNGLSPYLPWIWVSIFSFHAIVRSYWLTGQTGTYQVDVASMPRFTRSMPCILRPQLLTWGRLHWTILAHLTNLLMRMGESPQLCLG
jgi:hypothetical protein